MMASRAPDRPGPGAAGPGRRRDRPLVPVVVLLSLAAGYTDVLAVLYLGQAFASVITGNLVLLGASVALVRPPTLAVVVTAIGGYALGVLLATRLMVWPRSAPRPRRPTVPRWHTDKVGTLLMVETVLLATGWVGWLVNESAPMGNTRLPLLCLAAAAMGTQGVAVNGLGHPRLSTTYLTGALTRLVHIAGSPEPHPRIDRVQVTALVVVLAGAVIGAAALHRLPVLGPLPAAALVCAAAVLVRTAAADPAPDRRNRPE
jgi:uncharacterized membrane protein YoaK (UPF0700 family)